MIVIDLSSLVGSPSGRFNNGDNGLLQQIKHLV